MAKKTAKKFGSLTELAKSYNAQAGAANELQFQITDYLDMGSYMLNAQVSGSIFKGLPVGKSLVLAGKKGTGKTFIALTIAREAQRKFGSDIFWIDTEGAMDTSTMEGLGIDVSQKKSEVVIYPPENIEETSTIVYNVLDNVKGDKPSEAIIVVDSVSMTTTVAENKNVKEGDVKRDLSYQRELKKLFKTTINKARYKKVSMIFVSHIYDNIGGYGDIYKITGGESHQYSASTVLVFSKAKLKKEDDPNYDPSQEDDFENVKHSGVMIKSTPDKSRFSKAIPIELQLSWSRGLNRWYGLKDFIRDDDLDYLGFGPGSYSGPKNKRVFKPGSVKGAVRWGIKSKEKNFSNKDFYKAHKYIFTDDVLEKLDERIKPVFEFAKFIDEPITIDDLEDDVDVNDDTENESGD